MVASSELAHCAARDEAHPCDTIRLLLLSVFPCACLLVI